MVKPPWSARHGHAVVMTDQDVLILLGGHNGGNYLSDVWSIPDPSQALVTGVWSLITQRAPWSPRYGHSATINSLNVVFISGGFFANKKVGNVGCFNDVWTSANNGASWTLVTKNAPWAGRYQHTLQANVNDELFVVGGLSVDLERCADVWRSQDNGQTWSLVTPMPPWPPRYEHAVVSDKSDSLFILGGMSTSDEKFHDVWRSERTCEDDVNCEKRNSICRDGMDEHFEGIPNPICVDICDRRIFDDCKEK